jgi:hypothetical protein
LNFKKLLLIVIPLAIIIGAWQFFTRVDRTNPVAVGTAFTKALKAGKVTKAAGFYLPESASSWQEGIDSMKSGATERYNERLPAEPAFSAPVTSKAGITTLVSTDKTYTLEMKQVNGSWFVSKAPD